MMKPSILLIILLALLGNPASASAQDSALPPRPPQQPSPILLTANIISAQYCAGNRLDILQMRLRLEYKNISDQRLILYAGKNLFYQTKLRRVSRDLSNTPYEVAILNSIYRDEVTEAIDRPSPGRAFVVLAPGEKYLTQMVVGAGVMGDGMSRTSDTLIAGEHTLQIVASTWYESRKLGEELRRRWQSKGLLIIDPVSSVPQKFTVERNRSTVNCR